MVKDLTYIISLLIVVLTYGIVFQTDLSNSVDTKVYDIMSKAKFDDDSLLSHTVIVKIDEDSIAGIGQWPWSRLIMAQVMQEILKAKPAVLGLDVIFSEEDRTSPNVFEKFYKERLGKDVEVKNLSKKLNNHDKILADVISKGNTVFPIIASKKRYPTTCQPQTTLPAKGNFNNIPHANTFICNIPIIQKSAKNTGFINSLVSKDGLLRKYNIAFAYEGKLIPSLSVAMLKSVYPEMSFYEKKSFFNRFVMDFFDKTIQTNEKGEVLNYFYNPKRFVSVSALDVLEKKIDLTMFTGKFIILGTTAIALSDKYLTQDAKMASGVFAHASFLENAAEGNLLFSPDIAKILEYLASLICAFVLAYLILKHKYLYANMLFFASNIIGLILTWHYLSHGLYLPFGFFITPLMISYAVILIVLSFVLQKKEKDFALDLINTRSSITNNMMMMVESRDTETGKHIIRTKEYAKLLAKYLAKHSEYSSMLNKEFVEALYQATPLHDIGKVGIPDYILQKPGPLTDEERKIMQNHSQIGYRIISSSLEQSDGEDLFLKTAANIAYSHHERWDGKGYPLGLEKYDIPIEGRIVSVVDVYDALTSARCYKDAYGFEKSEKIILQGKGTQFDPIMVDAFEELKQEFKKIAMHHADNYYIFS